MNRETRRRLDKLERFLAPKPEVDITGMTSDRMMMRALEEHGLEELVRRSYEDAPDEAARRRAEEIRHELEEDARLKAQDSGRDDRGSAPLQLRSSAAAASEGAPPERRVPSNAVPAEPTREFADGDPAPAYPSAAFWRWLNEKKRR